MLTCWLRPDIAPPRPLDAHEIDTRKAVLEIWPVLVLMLVVFGGLFSGIFTATEAGAVGALGSILIAVLTKRLTWSLFKTSMIETLIDLVFAVSSSVVGAAMFTRFLGLTGLTGFLASAVNGADLNYVELMLLIVALYFIRACSWSPSAPCW